MKLAAKGAPNAEVHVRMGAVNALCLCPVNFPTILSSCLLEVISVGALFSGSNFAVYVVSHFDYCKCTRVEPLCRRDQKLLSSDLLYSGPGLVSTCLKFPCTSLGDMHKDIMLTSMLFTIDINI